MSQLAHLKRIQLIHRGPLVHRNVPVGHKCVCVRERARVCVLCPRERARKRVSNRAREYVDT